jgi:hypothetical protein
MTHTRNTPASRAAQFDDRSAPPDDRRSSASGDRDGSNGRNDRDESNGRNDRDQRREDEDHALDERSVRARTEDMTVLALGSGRYAVHSESGNDYLVDVREGQCSCPDHAIRGARCKHLRRVAIEITAGTVAPPSHVASTCASCGGFALVPPAAPEPHLCSTHAFAVGDRVRDRETGEVVVVVAVSAERADAVTVPGRDVTVAEYETNAAYPADDPVVAAVYPSVRVTGEGSRPETLRVYSFPLSRLSRVDDGSDRTDSDERGTQTHERASRS